MSVESDQIFTLFKEVIALFSECFLSSLHTGVFRGPSMLEHGTSPPEVLGMENLLVSSPLPFTLTALVAVVTGRFHTYDGVVVPPFSFM